MGTAEETVSNKTVMCQEVNTVELSLTNQPASFHRARYMTEGNRGPLRDRTGEGFPTIQLKGYNKGPVTVQCYIGEDRVIGETHALYKIVKVNGRNNDRVVEVPFGESSALQFTLRPEENMECTLSCIGIVKQRLFEIKKKQRKMETNVTKKSGVCRLVFLCKHPESDKFIRTYSEVIACKQVMKAPEIHRMSLSECTSKGGKELFIIGKNFGRDAKVLFKHAGLWSKVCEPQAEYFHKTHLVCNIPIFDPPINELVSQRVLVQICIVSGSKFSNTKSFTYLL